MEAMKLSLPIMTSGQEVTRVLNSWKRIFKTLGKDGVDLIRVVADHMFKYAQQDCTLCENEDDLEVNDRDQNVNASNVEEKISAINLIDYMARYSEGGFMEHIERAAGILLPLVNNPMDTGIQEAAVEALPSLVYCVFKHYRAQGQPPSGKVMLSKLVESILQNVVQAMPKESNVESLCAFAACIENLVAIDEGLTKFTINNNILKATTQALMECLQRSVERMDLRNNAMKEQGVDEEEIDKLKEGNKQESRLSTHISDAVNQLIKVYKEDYLQQLEGSMDALSYMLGPEGLDIQKACALYIFVQVIECCKPESYGNMLDFLKSSFFSSCGSQDIAVRQAGLYGMGILVEKTRRQPRHEDERHCTSVFCSVQGPEVQRGRRGRRSGQRGLVHRASLQDLPWGSQHS
eukprot:TRINITY_DN673_c1_g1_i3.p1 TRINITY_DN673_c1_g1~~TRINITY_DN673_c1_g1_i3.p1  ORF type:complete len:406 (+),score=67.54 TRINITY_DN673_c1_g1_i3:526-1743(+)